MKNFGRQYFIFVVSLHYIYLGYGLLITRMVSNTGRISLVKFNFTVKVNVIQNVKTFFLMSDYIQNTICHMN